MLRLLIPTVVTLFAGYSVASAADGALPDLGIDPILVAIGSALVSAVAALWKLHLDDDKRARADAEGWRTVGVGSAAQVAKLVELVGKIEAALSTEHALAQQGRTGDERFREYVRGEIATILAKLEALG